MPTLQYPILHLNEVMPKLDRTIAIHKSFANVISNDVYYKLMDMYIWMVEEITRSSRLWESVIQMTWQHGFLFKTKMFILWVIMSGLFLGFALQRRSITFEMHLICTF